MLAKIAMLAVLIITLILIFISSCSLRGGEWITPLPLASGFYKVCMIPDPNERMPCTNANQCKYACYVPKPEQFNGTGECAKWEDLVPAHFELDENGTLIREDILY